jgi:hypothetical protein
LRAIDIVVVILLLRNAMVPGNLRVSGQNKVKTGQKWGKNKGFWAVMRVKTGHFCRFSMN